MTVQTLTLAEFLLARIAEDEKQHVVSLGATPHDKPPASWRTRWLAECEAKRRIVELDICIACDVEMQPCDHRDETLALLTSVYADHPDFRAEWSA